MVASCVLRPGDARKLDGLTDSKLLTEKARDRMYDMVVARAVDYAVVAAVAGALVPTSSPVRT